MIKASEQVRNITASRNEDILGEVVGYNPQFGLRSRNLASTKRIIIAIKAEDGETYDVTCSPNVSAGLRDKSITLANLLHFPVKEQQTASKEWMNLVTLPGEDPEFHSVQAQAYVAQKLDPRQVIAFGD